MALSHPITNRHKICTQVWGWIKAENLSKIFLPPIKNLAGNYLKFLGPLSVGSAWFGGSGFNHLGNVICWAWLKLIENSRCSRWICLNRNASTHLVDSLNFLCEELQKIFSSQWRGVSWCVISICSFQWVSCSTAVSVILISRSADHSRIATPSDDRHSDNGAHVWLTLVGWYFPFTKVRRTYWSENSLSALVTYCPGRRWSIVMSMYVYLSA